MEYRRKCKTCRKIWCYTDNDLKSNKQNNAMATISAIGGIAAAIGGTPAQQYLNYDMMEIKIRLLITNSAQAVIRYTALFFPMKNGKKSR